MAVLTTGQNLNLSLEGSAVSWTPQGSQAALCLPRGSLSVSGCGTGLPPPSTQVCSGQRPGEW